MGVTVKLNGDGLDYTKEATIVQAAKIIGFLNTEEALETTGSYSRPQETNFIQSPQDAKAVSSPREAILDSGAKTNAQKILVLGNYITQRDGTDDFAPSEMKTLFVKAGEAAPRNLARDIRDAVRNGYITESVDTTGTYVVTNTGRQALEDGFGGATARSTSRRRSKSPSVKNNTTKRTVFEWIQQASVSDQMNNFPSFRLMNTRTDKILWILQWAKNQDHERISGPEIEAIASKLADSVPNKQIAAAASPLLSKGQVSKTAEGYSILYNGTEALKANNEGAES